MNTIGLKGMESLLKGADLDGAVILCEAPEGPERSAICYQFIREGLNNGERVLIVLGRGSPRTVKTGLRKIGVKVEEEVKKGSLSLLSKGEKAASIDPSTVKTLPSEIAMRLREMNPKSVKRVLVTGLNLLLSALPPEQEKAYLSELVGEIREQASLAMMAFDPAGFSEQAVKDFYEPFDGVLKVTRDVLSVGYMIGVATFDGVERTGIFLPLRKAGSEYVAGLAVEKGLITEPCPKCGAQILPTLDVCPNCGTDLRKMRAEAVPAHLDRQERRRKLETYLSSLGMLGEKERDVARERLKAHARSRAAARSMRAPSRTNGLTNGLVRRAGMVNGVGRTNGLVNGLTRTRKGVTNGLTNGSGFTNGLGSARFRVHSTHTRWKTYIITIVAAVLVISALMIPPDLLSPVVALAADGSFSEWSSAVPLDADYSLNRDIDLIGAGVQSGDNRLGFYFQVAGTILAGNSSGSGSDVFQAFVDRDRDASTGYSVEGIGAEHLIQVIGKDHKVLASSMMRWTHRSSQDTNDWSNWENLRPIVVAVGEGLEVGKMEVVAEFFARSPEDVHTIAAGSVLFHAERHDSSEDFSDFAISSRLPSVEVVQRSVAPLQSATGEISLSELSMRSANGPALVEGVNFTVRGNVVIGDVAGFRILSETGSVLGTQDYSGGKGRIRFGVPLTVDSEWIKMTVQAQVVSAGGRTLGTRIMDANDVLAPDASVSLFTTPSDREVTYLGQAPPGVVIDYAFSDWTGSRSDEADERSTLGDANIDIRAFEAQKGSTTVSFYMKVKGSILKGTTVPFHRSGKAASPASIDRDHDTVPDELESQFNDILPRDFNNDNISDIAQSSDKDVDGLEDYPGGQDMWLNTTLPEWFGQPYAFRFVSVYIGPEVVPPPNYGEDTLRVFIDTDDVPGSGFMFEGAYADHMVEIRGKDGRVLSKDYYRFTGVTPITWGWVYEGSSALAIGLSELEGEVTLADLSPGTNVTVVCDLRNWLSGIDRSSVTRSRSMTRSDDGGMFVQQGMYSLGLPDSLTAGSVEFLDDQGFGLRWRLVDMTIGSKENTRKSLTLSDSGLDVSGMDAIYRLHNMEIKYIPLADTIKEEIVLAGPPQALVTESDTFDVSFELSYLNGVRPRLPGGTWVSTSNGFEFITSEPLHFTIGSLHAFTIDSPFLVDSQGDRTDCKHSLSESLDTATLSIICPMEWLAKASYPVTLDPTILMNGYRGEGFGQSLAIGDFNGDGRGDLLVGAPYNSLGGSGAGRAYVYLGGTNMDNVTDLEIPGPSAGSHFGWAVAAGDVNGDSYSDMIIGAPDFNGGEGRAYLYLGSSTLDSKPDLEFVAGQSGEKYGYSLTAGNITGDSYIDLVIGAPSNDTGGTDIGAAYVYFGSSSPDSSVDKTLQGLQSGESFGTALGIGNFNGDAYEDVAVGAPRFVETGPAADGRVAIFHGGPGMDTVQDVNCTTGDSDEELGTSVSSTDRDDDTYDDLYAGGPKYGGATLNGRVSIFDGGSGMDGTADATLVSPDTYTEFGTVLANGRIVQDTKDVAAGSPRYRIGSTDPIERGRFDLYWNGTGSSVNRNGDNNYDHFATSITIGDINGSASFGELVIGAVDFDIADNTSSGMVYVFNGSLPTDFDTTPDLAIHSKDPGSRPGERLGFSVAVGDFNNDGYQDVLAGAPFNDNGGSETGSAYIFLGKPFQQDRYYGPDLMLPGQYPGERFGWNVSAGDVNGDGYDDAIIGAPYNDESGTNGGRAYVFYGGNPMDSQVDIDIYGTSTNYLLGWDVASGNVNGDQDSGNALEDIIISAPGWNNSRGRVNIHFGSTSLGSQLSIPDGILYRGDMEAFGSSVTVGNFNEDSYEDVLIGAPLNDTTSTDIGASYIYYGCSVFTNCFRKPTPYFYYNAKVGSVGGQDNTTDLLSDAQNDDATDDNNPPSSVSQGDGWYTIEKGNVSHFASLDISGLTYGNILNARLIAQDSVISGYDGNGTVNWKYSGAGWSEIGLTPQDGDLGVVRSFTLPGVDTFAEVTSVQFWFKNYATGSYAVSFDYLWVNLTLDGQQPANVTIKGQVNMEHFGHSVETGDLDGDSSYLDDAIVGAPYWYDTTNDTGAVYVVSGSTIRSTPNGGTISSPTTRLIGPGSTDAMYGWSLATGDVNGDSYDDLMVGAPFNNSDNGSVYWYYGPTSTLSLDFTSDGGQGERRGWALAASDLVTGYDAEAAMGCPWFNTTSNDGRVVLITSIPEFSDAIAPAMVVLLVCLLLRRRRIKRFG